ncbi:glycoside hydrolase family 43 protein [Catenovulum agarivorans]|uniref:glycoside hydrolase family 43 protein n=1 Tax=Catenovulum agarivorans TaxID=1172192 RepID=UPI0003187858|nr:glycoside hydrolase family 43 protein [Catenovulum agarivorans]
MKKLILAMLIGSSCLTLGCAQTESNLAAVTASEQQQEVGGYLFATFRGEATPMTEQVYFMLSQDGKNWQALNDSDPVLVSQLGDKGVRDPFLIRSPDNDKFFLIATDLSINLTNHDWGRASTNASQSLMVWESTDLVNWSEPRLVKVAPDNAGCVWAPEAIWDEEKQAYMAFWASQTADDNFSKFRIWAAHTKDFKTFSEPFVYIEKPTTVIDTTIVRENGSYYRFTKDEKHKAITMEKSDKLMSGWQDVSNFSLAKLKGYEGPAAFTYQKAQDGQSDKWTLLLDYYSQAKGYQIFETDNLASGQFTPGEAMTFPFHPVRHGTVLSLSKTEFARLKQANNKAVFTVGNKAL